MQKLPVTQVLPEISNHLSRHNRLILQAPPGAGKTTLVPLALLDQDWLAGKRIIILEPRRLATRNAAARMACLLGEKVGKTVGYQIRQDRCYSNQTRILVVTEGILTRKLQADPELAGVGLVIFDEFHERNLHGDLSLAFCLQSQELLNDELKILLMSATLNTAALAELLASSEKKTPVVSSQGRSFPIDIIHSPDNSAPLERWNLSHIVTQKTVEALTQHNGNILVFLPGVREIKQVERELPVYLSEHLSGQELMQLVIAPLYGDLSRSQQDQAISVPPAGQRKVVLATNIAETSLTIEGITVVIDSGLQREARFNPASGMNTLYTTLIAQDSAEQRSGRAGRLSAGTCYRLWSKSQHKRLPAHQSAEILHCDLAPMLLELAQWGIHEVGELRWLDLPPQGTTAQAKDLLLALTAIDDSGRITAHGKNMLSLGIHPRLAHMILTSVNLTKESIDLVESACLIAALVTEKDILTQPVRAAQSQHAREPRTSDIVYRLSVLQQLKQNLPIDTNLINKQQCKRVLQSAKEFRQRLTKYLPNSSIREHQAAQDMTGVLLAFAYPDRIAKLRNNKEYRYLLSNGKGAYFTDQDPLANEPYLVVTNLTEQANNKEARIFLAAAIDQQQLEDYFPDMIKQQSNISWNDKLQKVECLNKKTLGSLVLNEQANHTIDSKLLQPTLINAIKTLGLECLPWSNKESNKESNKKSHKKHARSATQLKQRVQFIRYQQQHNPSCAKQLAQVQLPDFSDDYLLAKLELWLLPYLSNENSIKQLQSLDLWQILNSRLDWEQLQTLDELAPEKIKVPSGSAIRIDYSDPEAAILAVRLQELFGLQQTPAIIRGSYPLLLHLLSPASRPMQVTQDLVSFWKNTYNEVKKELRGKYKKHYWPDDPLQAQATNRAKPRKS